MHIWLLLISFFRSYEEKYVYKNRAHWQLQIWLWSSESVIMYFMWCVYVYQSAYICMYVCIYICMYVGRYIYLCTDVHTYTYVYTYMHAYIQTFTHYIHILNSHLSIFQLPKLTWEFSTEIKQPIRCWSSKGIPIPLQHFLLNCLLCHMTHLK